MSDCKFQVIDLSTLLTAAFAPHSRFKQVAPKNVAAVRKGSSLNTLSPSTVVSHLENMIT